jgi:hypothetical protein
MLKIGIKKKLVIYLKMKGKINKKKTKKKKKKRKRKNIKKKKLKKKKLQKLYQQKNNFNLEKVFLVIFQKIYTPRNTIRY